MKVNGKGNELCFFGEGGFFLLFKNCIVTKYYLEIISFVCSFVRSFIRSLIYSFICSNHRAG